MVNAHHYCACTIGCFNSCWRWLFCCAFYLLIVLIQLNLEITRLKSIEACLAISTGLLVFYYFTENKYLLITAIVIGSIGLFSSFLSHKIAWLWWKIAEVLGSINGFILLSILFFILLTPIAWLMKLTKKDALKLKKNAKEKPSYYTERNHDFSPKDIEKPW